jgi:hypothetical protein
MHPIGELVHDLTLFDYQQVIHHLGLAGLVVISLRFSDHTPL